MTFFYKFGKKARVYYTLSISRGGGAGPRPPLDSPLYFYSHLIPPILSIPIPIPIPIPISIPSIPSILIPFIPIPSISIISIPSILISIPSILIIPIPSFPSPILIPYIHIPFPLHLKVGSGIDKQFLEIIRSYVDKFNVFYYADNLKVSTIVSINSFS